jgi:hypothetical protein
MIGSRAGTLALLGLLTSAGAAHAAEVTEVVAGVRVATPACPIAPLSVPDFLEALRVELASRTRASGATLVTLAIEPCDVGTTSVRVTATAAAGPVDLTREIALFDVAPPARPRTLALAVAELMRGVESARPPPLSPPVVARAIETLPSKTTSRPPRVVTAVEALGRTFPERSTTQWAGRVLLGEEGPAASFAVFLQAAAGERHVGEGDVSARSLGAGATFGAVNRLGPTRLGTGVVLSFDYTRLAGAAPGPGVVASAGGGVAIALGVRFALSAPVGDAWSLHAFAEPGLVLRHVDALVDGAPVAGLRGPMIAFGVGGAIGRP